ncbi:GNAT family N-acetyltransferase [Flammeovirgaceae bacterium SG7u.111]|nr:GNAT family N-acetyltransferase [Flammeovirgaceae bacterium SG7u.132]WPO37581.1 GNAT family N-acetyltransferase [Flammeovirgaceae bacterium SG7u.111]
MKAEQENLIEANISNLTSFWREASFSFATYQSEDAFDFCEIKNSDWPNRLWFKQSISQPNIAKAKEQIRSASSPLIVPHWELDGSQRYKLLEKNGFELIFEQVGMHMEIPNAFEEQEDFSLQRISSRKEANLWAELYPQAFGYKIGAHILEKTWGSIAFYLAFHKNQPVGTAILYQTGAVAGIHGVGVIPEMRKKGFAEQIMKQLINKSRENQAKHLVLQASAMGKGIYERLGFKEQFHMRNYMLGETIPSNLLT